jgi:hypothetical protein
MKKTIYILLWLSAYFVNAQPTVTNAGSFNTGDVLKFQPCSATGVYAGSGGPGQTWNFASLSPLAGTLVTSIVSPSSTTSGSLFPTATIAERNSDQTTNYITISQGKSFLTGFIDSTAANPITMRCLNSIQIQENPITPGTSVTDTFATSYTLTAGYTMRGHGISKIEGDAYGTLILPNGTYTNVLRVKLTQIETDSLLPGNSTYTNTTVSYIFFDGQHASSLMMIDSTHSGTTVKKSVKYLLEESNSNIFVGLTVQQPDAAFVCYPNPAHDKVTMILPQKTGVLYIRNTMGQTVRSFTVCSGELIIPVEGLQAGPYFIDLETTAGHYRTTLLVD